MLGVTCSGQASQSGTVGRVSLSLHAMETRVNWKPGKEPRLECKPLALQMTMLLLMRDM